MTGPRLELGFQVWAQNVSWDELMAEARTIEQHGFDTLWSNDHFLPLVSMDDEVNRRLDGGIFEGWTVLTGFACATSRVRIGCLVSGAGYRNVGVLGKMATTLDHASGGRAVLGLGAGWFGREHTAFGLAFPSAGERLDRLDESAAALRRLLAGDTVTCDGRWVQLHEARLDPLGVRHPERLPMMIGGSGPKRTLPIVARYADIWNGEGTPEEYAERTRRLDDLCRAAGRDPGEIERTVGLAPPLIRATRAEAVGASAEILASHGMPRALAREQAEASTTVGTVEQVATALARYQRAGATGVIFDWPPPFDAETLVALAGPIRVATSEAYARGA